jgi:N-glycosylase/DNA lyase
MVITINDDFDPDRIADSGQCFRWEKLENGGFRIIHREYCLRMRELEDTLFELSCTEDEFRDIWSDYFDLGLHYKAVRRLIKKRDDAFLFEACKAGCGIRILRQDPWETLISFIISQNKNIPAIKKSIELLCRAAGQKRLDTAGEVYDCFPTAEEILAAGEDVLNACRLGYRSKYVLAAAKDVAEGRLDLKKLMEADEETAIKALTAVFGVGIKVASCAALFGLHQIDAFPVDVWIRRILDEQYPDGYPMERYRPYNGIYQQYMFYHYRKTFGNKREA